MQRDPQELALHYAGRDVTVKRGAYKRPDTWDAVALARPPRAAVMASGVGLLLLSYLVYAGIHPGELEFRELLRVEPQLKSSQLDFDIGWMSVPAASGEYSVLGLRHHRNF